MAISKKYSEVINFIMQNRNGEVAEQMLKWGLNYNMNYGVSVVQLKNFARTLGKDQDLAWQLWKEDIRETKLFSFHVFNANELTSDEVDRIVEKFNNHELVEQACMNLFANLSFAFDKIDQWVDSDSNYVMMTGFMLLARLALVKKELDDTIFERYLPEIEKNTSHHFIFIKKSLTLAFVNIARKSDNLKAKVENIAQKLIESDNESEKFIGRNVLNEIEYV